MFSWLKDKTFGKLQCWFSEKIKRCLSLIWEKFFGKKEIGEKLEETAERLAEIFIQHIRWKKKKKKHA